MIAEIMTADFITIRTYLETGVVVGAVLLTLIGVWVARKSDK